MGTSLLQRLKCETKVSHDDLERHVNILSRVRTVSDYRSLLEVFYGVYCPVEMEIARSMCEIATWLPDIKNRMRTPLLVVDLQVLGNDRPETLPLATIPSLCSLSQCWGCLYVLEGSTLGGQIIAREVHNQLNYTRGNGCSFFASYGSEIGGMWGRFCAGLESYAASHNENHDTLIVSAAATFRAFDDWFEENL